MIALFRCLYYPLTILSALVLHFTGIGFVDAAYREIWPSVVAAVFLVLTQIFERIFPFHRPWLKGNSADVAKDVLSTLVLVPIVVKLCQVMTYQMSPWEASPWPSHWPFWLTLILGILLAEFFFYWIHRATHTFPVLWKFHFTHHVVPRVYWLNSGRLHPVDAFLNFFLYFIPLGLTLFPQDAFLAFLTLTLVSGTLEHANVDFRAGVLNYIFNTAELHRWHHSRVPATSKTNYGKITCFWDLVFGTFHLPRHQNGITEVGAD